MPYRVMVRSREGWRMTHGTGGAAWGQRFAWSTWSQYEDEREAREVQRELASGGVRATTIDEEDYPRFCDSHTIA
jgi:hypothetical protein